MSTYHRTSSGDVWERRETEAEVVLVRVARMSLDAYVDWIAELQAAA